MQFSTEINADLIQKLAIDLPMLFVPPVLRKTKSKEDRADQGGNRQRFSVLRARSERNGREFKRQMLNPKRWKLDD